MSLGLSLSAGFYTGGVLSADVPTLYMHALDGHNYLLDTAQEGDFRHHHRTIPLLKPQTQTTDKLGERSINPNGLWRSSIESWHKGCGQLNYDLDESDPARFRSSKGVDWATRWQLSLLPDTTQFASSANTNLRLAPTSTRLFWLDGTDVKYDDDLSGSPSTMTGPPGTTWTSITTDGYNVWACDGTSLYDWVRTDTAIGAAVNTGDLDLVVWVPGKARLMGAHDSDVYNITTVGAAYTDIGPSTISTDFRWVGFAEGPSVVYGAGYQGDKSMIFRWGIRSDGTGLDAAVPALVDGLPDGEIVQWIKSGLGFLLIGVDDGVRFAIPDKDTGNLTVGAKIDLDAAVRCFEFQGSSVYFGWTNYDSTSTGLGRISLTTFTDADNLVPAYGSDLMATTQGAVLDVCTFLGRRVFTVSGAGVYVEHATNKVASGTIESGWRSFGIPEEKVALRLDVRHDTIAGSVAAAIAVDGSATYTDAFASSSTYPTGAEVSVGQLRGEKFETQITLTRDSGDTTTGPTVTREVLKINPTADTGLRIIAPVMLNRQDTIGTVTRQRDPNTELQFLEELRSTRRQVTWQSGSLSYPVSLEDFVWLPEDAVDGPNGDKAYTGTCVLDLKVA